MLNKAKYCAFIFCNIASIPKIFGLHVRSAVCRIISGSDDNGGRIDEVNEIKGGDCVYIAGNDEEEAVAEEELGKEVVKEVGKEVGKEVEEEFEVVLGKRLEVGPE